MQMAKPKAYEAQSSNITEMLKKMQLQFKKAFNCMASACAQEKHELEVEETPPGWLRLSEKITEVQGQQLPAAAGEPEESTRG